MPQGSEVGVPEVDERIRRALNAGGDREQCDDQPDPERDAGSR
jgi:hypothetical protein